MDVRDMFENFGLGLGIAGVIIVFLIAMTLIVAIIPALFMRLGGFLFISIAIIAIIAVIYFIGKFFKDLIKK